MRYSRRNPKILKFTSREISRRVNKILNFIGLKVIRLSTDLDYQRLSQAYYRDFRSGADIDFLTSLPGHTTRKMLELIRSSQAQIRQDLFALAALDFKRNGYFVDFGATNGIDLSNTFLMEHEFNWTGILCEPARVWHEDLQANRSSMIDTRCVWSTSAEQIEFIETTHPELSTTSQNAEFDSHSTSRNDGKKYYVESVSLMDLLIQHGAPKHIDYLSIDTEGSEFIILKDFDFARYTFRVITVEHNYTSQRRDLFELLTSVGYQRVYPEISQFDDWYINSSFIVDSTVEERREKNC
jgi:FkbM family methyltransferase